MGAKDFPIPIGQSCVVSLGGFRESWKVLAERRWWRRRRRRQQKRTKNNKFPGYPGGLNYIYVYIYVYIYIDMDEGNAFHDDLRVE